MTRSTAVPFPDLSTRDRLKVTARRLFAERGIEGVTIRDILSAAGEKNGASISYYFGSKDELIREIITDLFTLMDARWKQGLEEVEKNIKNPGIRDYIRILVKAANQDGTEEVPTIARLADRVSHQHYSLALSIMKEYKLNQYDKVLSKIAENLPHLPRNVLRQRLIFLTRYLSTVFALYESARVGGSDKQRMTLGGYDLGNVCDTAVGLLTAEVVDAAPN